MAFTQKAASVQIAAYDTTNPFQQLTIGEGAPGRLWVIEDSVAIATTYFAATNDYVRLCRFPSNAIIKKVELFTDLSLVDGGTSSTALVLSVGVIFSDSTIDGTPVAYQNMHPTTVGIGGGRAALLHRPGPALRREDVGVVGHGHPRDATSARARAGHDGAAANLG